jgi:hypothetical protein
MFYNIAPIDRPISQKEYYLIALLFNNFFLR